MASISGLVGLAWSMAGLAASWLAQD